MSAKDVDISFDNSENLSDLLIYFTEIATDKEMGIISLPGLEVPEGLSAKFSKSKKRFTLNLQTVAISETPSAVVPPELPTKPIEPPPAEPEPVVEELAPASVPESSPVSPPPVASEPVDSGSEGSEGEGESQEEKKKKKKKNRKPTNQRRKDKKQKELAASAAEEAGGEEKVEGNNEEKVQGAEKDEEVEKEVEKGKEEKVVENAEVINPIQIEADSVTEEKDETPIPASPYAAAIAETPLSLSSPPPSEPQSQPQPSSLDSSSIPSPSIPSPSIPSPSIPSPFTPSPTSLVPTPVFDSEDLFRVVVGADASSGNPLRGPVLRHSLGTHVQKGKGEDKWIEGPNNSFFYASPSLSASENEIEVPFSAFAVFDGHGGRQAALLASKRMLPILASFLQKSRDSAKMAALTSLGDDAFPEALKTEQEADKRFWVAQDALIEKLPKALYASFLETDRECQSKHKTSGTTATVVVQVGWELVIASVGDSCAYLDTGAEVIQVSGNHRVDDNLPEQTRIKAAGGHIAQSDVDGIAAGPLRAWPGGLAMSRTLGDYEARSVVIPDPEIRQCTMPVTGGRLIIASDGLWDAQKPKQVLGTLKSKSAGESSHKATYLALNARGLVDDVTVLIVDFFPWGMEKEKTVPAVRGDVLKRDIQKVLIWYPNVNGVTEEVASGSSIYMNNGNSNNNGNPASTSKSAQGNNAATSPLLFRERLNERRMAVCATINEQRAKEAAAVAAAAEAERRAAIEAEERRLAEEAALRAEQEEREREERER
eukprot:CAMPEP_0175054170 /NCGR_PEP_ID=MMETSP0052_2-20121109/9353_1 /TAXON_ID=51329 ORGANISM="Polytomella parva, Strain SAG 63-3" /NCGR_SAMPLE_ID=MMETSP0052_2 /ASSEMBLY_ACC=CAM_ASM_000194 /LENGTH=769 /DNA_ID=CAMNT_0016318829 /DNA_START=93 /DNA_END=2399 /DNA_ORIENTATION=-